MVMVRCFTVLAAILCNISVNGESSLEESADTECGNIFTGKQFVLMSENYPSSYPQDKECFYLLKGETCTVQFNLEFLKFDVKTSIGCINDRLEIGHQDALCGSVNGSRVYSAEKGSLKLKFISDNERKNNRGFRVLVTRIDACHPDNSSAGINITFENRGISDITTDTNQVEWTSTRPLYIAPIVQQCCQNNIYGSKRFLLVSPNFPYSTNSPTDCIYTIKKASSQVCRLRINILFFSLGPPTQTSCPYGHLEVDGKYICGCNTDLKLTTNFRDLESKVLKYHSTRYNANEFYGFVLEVIQDECPKKYSPDDGVLAEKSPNNFRFYNDQYNKVSWPENSDIDQVKLVNEKVLWSPTENPKLGRKFENVYKHFYFFAPQDEEDITWTNIGQEREETNYIEISTINTLLTNLYSYQQCVQWNRNQMVLLNTRFGNNLYQMCKSFQQNNVDASNCLVLSTLSGNIRSPRYPSGYPASQNLCYRFQILPGYCAVNLLFNDFQIEKSYDCLKDYLTINQYRYCGNYLKNKQVTINTKGKSHQDLHFITDANYCGKGFSAVYQQVPCQNSDSPITPIDCNPGIETTENPVNCNKMIRENYFIIRNEDRTNFCTFNIRKFSEDICKIQLYFERFNLPCDSESITIAGKVYCGQMFGHTLTIDIQYETTILYKRNNYLTTNYIGDFLIRGTQISDDCEAGTPEPVRLTLENSLANEALSYSKWDKKTYPSNSDICKLIQNNVTTEELPNKICELLIKNQNVFECNFSKADFIDLPTNERNVTKIRLTSGGVKDLNYKVIECQN